jgi:hypothetical protein
VSVFLALGAIWINRQALETDSWTETSSELLEDPAIRTAVAGFLVDRLYEEVDVTAELSQALPPRAQPLAGPAAGALRNLAERIANELLQRPRVQALWEDANRAAHEQLIFILEGGGPGVSTEAGVVTLDLTVILGELAQRTGLSGNLVAKIPPDAAQIEVLQSDELDFAQDVADSLRPLALLLTLLALALYGGAIAVARDRRRETLRAAGYGFIAGGALMLVARGLAGDAVVDALATTEAVRPAAESVWEIGTSLLHEAATAAIAYGVVIVLAAWLAGPTRVAVGARRALAPYLRQPGYAYGGLLAIVLLLVWWGPTPATRRLVPGLILLGLLVAGLALLRRQTAREFPDAPMPDLGAAVRGWAERVRSAFTARREPTPAAPASGTRGNGGALAAAEATADALASLERLADLHDRGALTDEEFAAQKRELLTPVT